jgi:hypothetical protein
VNEGRILLEAVLALPVTSTFPVTTLELLSNPTQLRSPTRIMKELCDKLSECHLTALEAQETTEESATVAIHHACVLVAAHRA